MSFRRQLAAIFDGFFCFSARSHQHDRRTFQERHYVGSDIHRVHIWHKWRQQVHDAVKTYVGELPIFSGRSEFGTCATVISSFVSVLIYEMFWKEQKINGCHYVGVNVKKS